VAVQFCISSATTLEATQDYWSCGRRPVRATHRRSSDPFPVASYTPRFPVPTQPHHRNVAFYVFAARVLCWISPAALYIVRHPYCISNPPAVPCCLNTNDASERACGALSPTVCQLAGHSQPLGSQDTTSSLTLLREPTIMTMPSTRKRTRAASQAGAFACVLLCFVVTFFWYRPRRGREDRTMFFPHYM